ncbi:MAG: hypothetical protein GWO24_04375, partial [Akkermansiaceae bacterium]|nr:hypothetical protein [Akkermansiaceae bacterium]
MEPSTSGSRGRLWIALLAALTSTPTTATILLFENVNLPQARELDGLQGVKGYGDHVSDAGTGGFENS